MTNMRRTAVFAFIVSALASGTPARADLTEGIVLMKQGRYREADAAFEAEKNRTPDDPAVHYYIGKCQYSLGNADAAVASLRRAVELKPGNADYHYETGFVLLAAGDAENALKEFDEAVKAAPRSYAGKLALIEKTRLEKTLADTAMVREWRRKEEEKRLEEEAKKAAGAQQTAQAGTAEPGKEGIPGQQGMPPEMAGMPPGQQAETPTQPIEKVIKQLKFGTDTQRANASNTLVLYPSDDLKPHVEGLVPLFDKETLLPVRRNILRSVGKAATPEGADVLLGIVGSENQLFELKLVALESLGETREEKVATALRTSLDRLVTARVTQREEARKNIADVETRLDDLQAQELTLNGEVAALNQQRNDIENKLAGGTMFGGEMPPGTIPQGAPAPGVPPEMAAQILKPDQIKKLQADLKKVTQDIKAKEDRLKGIQNRKKGLLDRKTKYEALLARKAQSAEIQPAQQFAPGPPDMMAGGYQPSQEVVDEERNEQLFALTLIKTLGSIRDKESLQPIRRAWEEYGVRSEEIWYFLTLARLEEYSRVPGLVLRLKSDFPQTGTPEGESSLRAGIVTVLGEYVKANPDEDIKALIEFLSEDTEHPEIRAAAARIVAPPPKAAEQKKDAKKQEAKKP